MTTVMAQSSPQAAIIPSTESFPVEMTIAITGRLLALTTETQEAEVGSCKERGLTEERKLAPEEAGHLLYQQKWED